MATTFDSRFIGGILLIVGTCIGGGMLALPVSNGPVGFFYSSGLMILAWFIMVLAAFTIVEVNLWFPPGSNLISMARSTLGIPGKVITWIVYLFLLYALLSAYIAGGSDIFQSLLHQISLFLPTSVSTLLFVLIFGSIVYSGIKAVDYTNRLLMFGKFGVCLLLLFLILPQAQMTHLSQGNWHHAPGTFMILIASFGFANIVPSLRTYFQNDTKKLRRAIIIGSLIPLLIYIAWDAAIMGVIPIEGAQGLLSLLHSNHSTSDLTLSLQSITQNTWITYFFRFFSSICMLTAFLGVSLGLFDFLADGLKIQKHGRTGLLIFALAYLPPLILVLFCPGIFITALNYAGLFAVALLILIPAFMLLSGRYIKHLPHKIHAESLSTSNEGNKYWKYEDKTLHPEEYYHAITHYHIKKGKSALALLLIVSVILFYVAIPN